MNEIHISMSSLAEFELVIFCFLADLTLSFSIRVWFADRDENNADVDVQVADRPRNAGVHVRAGFSVLVDLPIPIGKSWKLGLVPSPRL
jgi:hypothetical protein